MADNRAVLFTGPAGSGKTLLAVEAARREVAAGGTGRLLCFNRLLGRRLKEQTADIHGLRFATFHQELLRIAGNAAPPHPTAGFWDHELVERALQRLLDDDETDDFLIIDELQDLARYEYLDDLDNCSCAVAWPVGGCCCLVTLSDRRSSTSVMAVRRSAPAYRTCRRTVSA